MGAIDPRLILEGIIAWMRSENVAPTRTRVVKFLYLADLHWARYHQGETATGWEWKVDSFGPLAPAALRLLDEGERDGWLRSVRLNRDDDVRSTGGATLYDVIDRGKALETMPPAFGQVRTWIKRYGDNTGQLLRFVYGNTEPMMEALPGDVLNFRLAEPPTPARPIAARPIANKDMKRLKEMLVQLRTDYGTRETAFASTSDAALYDEAYSHDLPRDEDAPAGEVLLSFDAE